MEDIIQQLLSLKENKEIEHLAQRLSFDEALKLLDYLQNTHKYEGKVSAIFAGFSKEFFLALILQRIDFLKSHAHLEIVQHNLTLAASELNSRAKLLESKTEEIEAKIKVLDPPFLLLNIPDVLNQLIKDLEGDFDYIQPLIELTWISERPDLIEIYSKLKETYIRLRSYLQNVSVLLKERLAQSLGNEDTAFAIEGLVSLGFVYPEDWKELLGEKDQFKNEPDLIVAVQERLSKAGITTVKDLKQNEIFSKDLLLRFLKNQKNGARK